MPIALPSPQLRLSAAEAGAIAARGRQLLRRGRLTPHQYALLDALLWGARKPGEASLVASGRFLAKLAGQARSTVVAGVAALERLGLVQRIRRRIRVAWIGAAVASRQVANGYCFSAARTESATPPALPGIQIFSLQPPSEAAARDRAELARIAGEMRQRFRARLEAQKAGEPR